MKGFFGFAAVLTMSVLLLFYCAQTQKITGGLEQTKNELIKAEQANKERTIIENNVDKIIWAKLAEQVQRENYNTYSVQNEINSALGAYLKKTSARAATIFYSDLGEVTTGYLNQNSTVEILKTEGPTYAEYVYSSTPMKTTIVIKKLGNDIQSYFEIPIGYTVRVLG